VHLGIAVDLARRREQEASPLELREPERVVRPVGADLERLQRQAQVVDRAGRAGQVVDEINWLLDLEVARQVEVEKEELLASVVLDVLQRPRLEVVDTDHAVAAPEERVAEMRSEEAGTARDD
jgi:RNase P/RNase MRP subunit p29